jgi:Flp pilus assembly protein TadB
MYIIELILEVSLILVFTYETYLALKKRQPAEQTLRRQARLKFIALPLGSLLVITFIVGVFHDLHYLIGLALLLTVIALSARPVSRAFKAGKPLSASLIVRNLLMLLIFTYDIILPIFY